MNQVTGDQVTLADAGVTGRAQVGLRDLQRQVARLPGMGRLRFALAANVGMLALHFVYADAAVRWSLRVWLLLVCLAVLLYAWSTPQRAVRAFWRTLESAGGELDFAVNETGIQFVAGEARTDVAWEDVRRYLETRQDFVVFTRGQGTQALPKRAFALQDLKIIRALLRRHVARGGARSFPVSLPLLVGAGLVLASLVAWTWLQQKKAPKPPPPPVLLQFPG